jgi:arginine decarboxylase
MQECYNDAIYYRDEVRQLFKHGNITLRERITGENIFWHVMKKIAADLSKLKNVPSELQGIENALADIYYGNFSVFQSLPDAWAIDHLFPIMPVHRLNEAPRRNAIIADITCDCDGKIDKFIDTHNVRQSLPLHDFKADEEYYLGVFLVGAYQETLGDLHNLLGDTNIVSIQIKKNGDFKFIRELEGDSVADVLSYVEYDTKAMVVQFRETAEKAVRQGLITPNERQQIMRAYQKGLRGYTYFEK